MKQRALIPTLSLAAFAVPAPAAIQDSAPPPQLVRQAADLNLLEGFEGELLYTVPKDVQGSWVSLTTDDAGRLYASDQGGKGLYRITPAVLGEPDAATSVERVDVGVSGAQGMCWAFDSLYVNVNGQGVWRIRDTNGDDQLDEAVNIIPLGSGGEHGPHAVILTEDGTGLYFLGGNHTAPPAFEGSRAPSNWGEDHLLPRQWDARGHARGKLAPGGWIARCEPDGTNIQIISNGYRNQYDMALNQQGELFTYDADMEWDHGTPWYRPTRVCLATSGSEFGWRSGTGKWPSYYEDSLPPVVELGPGSPTGIVFGTGARFPARYQEALFILDWTFGTIYAIHTEPSGAGYTGQKEHFAWSKPLAVTDAIVGDDGALYFAVGGRGTQSALYRIHYTGPESTAPAAVPAADAGSVARAQRRGLEKLHGGIHAGAVEAAWPHLSSTDRFVRFAARIAIESQPVDTWRGRALAERDPQASVMALIALARQGSAEDLPGVLEALGRLNLGELPEAQVLAALRAHALAFIRLGAGDDARIGIGAQHLAVRARLEPLLPTESADVNAELVRLLTYLQSPAVVEKTLALMASAGTTPLPEWADLIQRNDQYGGPIEKMLGNMPPTQGINYALMLRNATEGWSMPHWRAYFEFFVEAARHPGGASYPGFLTNIRKEAEAQLTVVEKRSLDRILGESLVAPVPQNLIQPEGPGREWSHAEAISSVGARLRGRNFERGRHLYYSATCGACHRFAGEGGSIGPDLSTVASKFSMADLLEAIVEPSKVISDQYGSHLVADLDGRVAEGLLVEDGDQVVVYTRDHNAEPTVFERSEIDVIKESTISQMPTGLIDPLSEEELKDLVAYLMSGGNKKAAVFKPE